MIKDRLKANPVPIQYRRQENFQGIVDLVEFKAYIYKGDFGREIEEAPVPEDMIDIANKYRKI